MNESKCPNGGKNNLEFNPAWHVEFDRLDSNVPAADLIWKMIEKKGIPRSICKSCGYEVMGVL